MANNNHFSLTLDTLGPVGAIKRPKDFESGETQYIAANGSLRITKGDATLMKIWFNTSATGAKTDEGYTGGSWVAAATTATTAFTAAGNYYYHMVLMDDVNNESEVYNTAVITFDPTAPTLTDKWLEDKTTESASITNQTTVALKAEFTDNLSGVVKLVYKEITAGVTDTDHTVSVSGSSHSVDVTFLADSTSGIIAQGVKTYEIDIYDACGNHLASRQSTSITYDSVLTKPAIAFLDSSFGTLPEYINYHGDTTASENPIYLQLACADTDVRAYKLWEDTGASSEPEWTVIADYAASTAYAIYTPVIYDNKVYTSTAAITAEENTGWAAVSSKFAEGLNVGKAVVLSSGDGLKVAQGKVRDSAQTIATADYIYRVVDTTNPVATISSNKDVISNVDGYTTATLTIGSSDDITVTGTAYAVNTAYSVKDCVIYSGVKYFFVKDIAAEANTGWEATSSYRVLANEVNSVVLTVGGTTISAWTGKSGTYNLTSADSMAAGDNIVKATATDKAGNTHSAQVTVALDTQAPTAALTALNTWYNAAFDISLTSIGDNYYSTGHDISLQAWKSTNATDTTAAGTVVAVSSPDTTATITAAQIGGTFAESADNYMHVKVTDSVGNVTYLHAKFGYDSVVPTGSFNFSKSSYPSRSAQIYLSYQDATSGVAYYKVYGDITINDVAVTEEAAEWTAVTSIVGVTLTDGDGTKTVHVKYKDNAGNISTECTATTVLDTSAPAANIVLREIGDTAAKEAHSKVAGFAARISQQTALDSGMKYQIYGDFTRTTQASQGLTYKACTLYAPATAYEANVLILHEGTVYNVDTAITADENTKWSAISSKCSANTDYWKDLTYDSGKEYKLEDNLYCTTGDGTKTANVRLMDAAGNISEIASASFVYDTAAPEPTVSNPDYNRISKIHTLRYSGTSTVAGKYADVVNFTTTPGEAIQAYKVCAYKTIELAVAGSYADDPIPQSGDTISGLTPQSVNTHASGLSSSADVSTTIYGADYEYAIEKKTSTTGEYDGAHIVVVYVQDLSGTWSTHAIFDTYYNITTTLTNCYAASSSATTIEPNGSATVTVIANAGYVLPSAITVSGAEYTYNAGVISLTTPTGAVSIAVTATPEITVEAGGTAKGVEITHYDAATETTYKNELVTAGTFSSDYLANAAIVNMSGTSAGTVVLNISKLGSVGDAVKIVHRTTAGSWETLYDGTIPESGLVTVTVTSFSPFVACKVKTFTITATCTNCTADSSNPSTVKQGNEVELNFTANDGYTFSDTAPTVTGATVKSWTVTEE